MSGTSFLMVFDDFLQKDEKYNLKKNQKLAAEKSNHNPQTGGEDSLKKKKKSLKPFLRAPKPLPHPVEPLGGSGKI